MLALGTSGALSVFAPLQPWLAALSIALLLAALALRRRILTAAGRVAVSRART